MSTPYILLALMNADCWSSLSLALASFSIVYLCKVPGRGKFAGRKHVCYPSGVLRLEWLLDFYDLDRFEMVDPVGEFNAFLELPGTSLTSWSARWDFE